MNKCTTLHDAMKKLVGEYGKELYRDRKIINYISDFYRFEPMALFTVMKTIVVGGYAEGLLDASNGGDWKLYVQKSMSRVQNQYGYDGKYVNYCFQCLAYGLGIFPYINQVLLDMINGKQVPPPTPPVSVSAQTDTRKGGQHNKSNRKGSTKSASTPPPPPPQVRIPAQRKQRNSINTNTNSQPTKYSGCSNGCSNTIIILMILYFIGKCAEG